ncbi:hypothetical protein MSG28_007006 [Choristoneura fumiferana]|uniref:Uncharacterized protein n=1 Tax=Choristoneura fumiferana TaxID=7141 RepID=A0ACC0JM00_CHOFU|nr:hypothetical protein MSG28_007006 [Choristoneura fumiferana]
MTQAWDSHWITESSCAQVASPKGPLPPGLFCDKIGQCGEQFGGTGHPEGALVPPLPRSLLELDELERSRCLDALRFDDRRWREREDRSCRRVFFGGGASSSADDVDDFRLFLSSCVGHDGLSVEHVFYGSDEVCRVLAMLFNLCLMYGILPDKMMKTVVVPVVKNRTGDLSSLNNYRPVSLGSTVGKILEGLLRPVLAESLKIDDAQFGFRPDCGVRRGGLTSPDLFGLYMNDLIEELRSSRVGCHIGKLWTKYTKRAISALRVQYNDAFRILLRLPRFCSAKSMFFTFHIQVLELLTIIIGKQKL